MDIRFASFLKHMTLCGAIYLLEKEQDNPRKKRKGFSFPYITILYIFFDFRLNIRCKYINIIFLKFFT